MNLRRFEKATEYDVGKKNKADNYALLNKNHCKKGQIVLAGDSITDFYNYYELFAAYRKESGKMIYNRGISGDTTNRLLERLQSNVLCLEPEKVVYLIGTNDIACKASLEYIADNIRKLITETKKHCPGCKIAVQSVYPVIDHRERKNKDIIPLNELIKAVCREENVFYIDLYDKLCDESGSFSKKFTYDGLHPNVRGYEVITEGILEFI